MKVVIDIPTDDFNSIYHGGLYAIGHDALDQCITEAFQTAVIIPKGHGDLVDISKLYDQKIEQWNPFVEFLGEEYVPTGAIETYAPIVIPADKGEE